MIKIEIKEGLKIEVDLSIKDSVELVNFLIKNKNDMEVKLLITHLSTIVECYKNATMPIGKILVSEKRSPRSRTTLADLLKD